MIGHWYDYGIVQYIWEIGEPPDNLSWTDAHLAFERVIERARAAELAAPPVAADGEQEG